MEVFKSVETKVWISAVFLKYGEVLGDEWIVFFDNVTTFSTF